jgi:hypothetical protein
MEKLTYDQVGEMIVLWGEVFALMVAALIALMVLRDWFDRK